MCNAGDTEVDRGFCFSDGGLHSNVLSQPSVKRNNVISGVMLSAMTKMRG